MLAVINIVEFSFKWNGVTIVRLKDDQSDCFYFLDSHGQQVTKHCHAHRPPRTTLRLLKNVVIRYIKNNWVETS